VFLRVSAEMSWNDVCGSMNNSQSTPRRGVSTPFAACAWFLSSLALPGKALAIGVGVVGALIVIAAAAKHTLLEPVDITWLFYTNFTLVYALQVAPILIYGAFSLKRPTRFPHHAPQVRFLVLIPAHNEEAVIHNPVESLIGQSYPKHLYQVWVVSDGCTDRTDEIARALGAGVIRTNSGGMGKHRALGHAFAQLLPREDTGLYVCIIDADNRVDPNYLQEMNNAICQRGFRALQSFHDVLNGSDNWVTKSLWLNCVASSHLYNPGRSQSFGTALICGTGWCCQAGLLTKYWPMIRTQTEDIELTGLLLLHEGIGVPWIAGTHIYDEKPRNLWVAIRQRHRWMIGHMRVAGYLFWPLVRDGIRRRDPRLIELAAYYLLPFVMNLGNLQVFLLAGVQLGILAVQGPFGGSGLQQWAVNAITVIYVFVYQVAGFGTETRQWGRAVLYSLYAVVFSFLAWTPALIWACFTVSRQDWVFHTPHIAGIDTPMSATRARAG
jgi:cellulose synthase/poly-beta-1,6-N-acetylglucosamine synthase-like glycosyltransferase